MPSTIETHAIPVAGPPEEAMLSHQLADGTNVEIAAKDIDKLRARGGPCPFFEGMSVEEANFFLGITSTAIEADIPQPGQTEVPEKPAVTERTPWKLEAADKPLGLIERLDRDAALLVSEIAIVASQIADAQHRSPGLHEVSPDVVDLRTLPGAHSGREFIQLQSQATELVVAEVFQASSAKLFATPEDLPAPAPQEKIVILDQLEDDDTLQARLSASEALSLSVEPSTMSNTVTGEVTETSLLEDDEPAEPLTLSAEAVMFTHHPEDDVPSAGQEVVVTDVPVLSDEIYQEAIVYNALSSPAEKAIIVDLQEELAVALARLEASVFGEQVDPSEVAHLEEALIASYVALYEAMNKSYDIKAIRRSVALSLEQLEAEKQALVIQEGDRGTHEYTKDVLPTDRRLSLSTPTTQEFEKLAEFVVRATAKSTDYALAG